MMIEDQYPKELVRHVALAMKSRTNHYCGFTHFPQSPGVDFWEFIAAAAIEAIMDEAALRDALVERMNGETK